MIMYPSYLTDTAFHIDVADAILPHLPLSKPIKKPDTKALDPSNKNVKISASWALANLTDTLVQADSEVEEKFPVSIAKKILYKGMVCSKKSFNYSQYPWAGFEKKNVSKVWRIFLESILCDNSKMVCFKILDLGIFELTLLNGPKNS